VTDPINGVARKKQEECHIMISQRFFIPIAASLMILAGCGNAGGKPAADDPRIAGRDDIEQVEAEDPEMNAAIADAQRNLPQFIAIVRNPPPGTQQIGFKYPLGGWEHIWVGDVSIDGNFLTGRLSNVPAQDGHAQGDSVRVAFSDVSDWAYRDASGRMHGHRTTRVLLPRLDPEQAAAVRQDFRW
jgi:uncharacterized protein YegJ (DUF2314 family)